MADGPPIDDLAQSLVRLGELDIRICMMMAEAAATANGPDGGKKTPMAAEIPVTPARSKRQRPASSAICFPTTHSVFSVSCA
jgi:hypothetical protein